MNRALAAAGISTLAFALLAVAAPLAASPAPGPESRTVTTGTGPMIPLDVLRPDLDGNHNLPGHEMRFGASVAVDGDWLAVGAPEHVAAPDGREQGAVFFYQRTGGARWEQRQRIEFGTDHALCGSSVALAGPYALVGCRTHSTTNISRRGRIVFYERDPSTGQYGNAQAVLGPPLLDAYCGASVAMHGNGEAETTFAAVGCPGHRAVPNGDAGVVDIYQRVAGAGGGTWQIVQTLTGDDTPDGAWAFGSSVAIHRTGTGVVRVAVGEPHYNIYRGRAHLFRRAADGGAFVREATRVLPGEQDQYIEPQFGTSIALGPTDWFVGAENGDFRRGQVVAYYFNGLAWNQGTVLMAPPWTPPATAFGSSIATSHSGISGNLWIGQNDIYASNEPLGGVHRYQRIGGGTFLNPLPLDYEWTALWSEESVPGAVEGPTALGSSMAVDEGAGAALAGAPLAAIPEQWGQVVVFGADRILANGFGCRTGLPGC